MLIIYRKSDGLIASNSGTNTFLPDGPPFEAEVQNAIRKLGGVAEDYGEYRLNDEADAELVQQILNAGSYDLTLDSEGKPNGVRIYPRLTAEASPNPAAVNDIVTVTAALPLDSPDSEVVFQIAGGTAYSEPATGDQASHAYAFATAGDYMILVSSAHHGVAQVGVKVR